MAQKIIDVNALDQSIKDYGDYALYALATRVCADYRDGLKQVHRRILQAMARLGANPGVIKKAARILGETLKEHPHGEVSVYDAIKILANDFDIYITLVKGSGNWGNIDGDDQAASRYTDACLSQFAYDNFIKDVKATPQIVDWIPTFDNEDMEAQYLSSRVPLIMINGNYAIGIGMMSVISKHNINEVIDETRKLLRNPKHEIVLKPDQCMNCDIIDTDWKAIANTGHGSYIVRGRMIVIPEVTNKMIKDNKKLLGLPAVEIISTPDYVTLNAVKDKITKLLEDKILPQVIDICSNESKDETEMGCLIILKKGSDPKFVMDMIYKHTEMQHTVTENYQILYKYNPVVWGQKQILQEWIEWDRLRLTRKYYQILQYIRTQLSNKDAYVKCLESNKIDQILSMIRKRKDTDFNAAIEWLINKVDLTVAQAKFILDQKVWRLSEGYLAQYRNDVKSCLEDINKYEQKILNIDLLDKDIDEELLDMKSKYGIPRKCSFIDKSVINNIPKGEFKLIITAKNFIKKIAINDPIGNLKDDRAVQLLKIDNTESIFLFDNIGKVYKLPIHKIPVSDKSSNGCDVRLLIKNLTANICTVMSEPVLLDLTKRAVKHFIVVQSKLGNIKKMDIEDILGAAPSGLIYSKLASNEDYINDVVICPDGLDVISYSDSKALRYNVSQIPHLKRSTSGSRAMKSDFIDGLVVLNPNMTDLIVITEKGYINKFDALGLLTLQRGKSGNTVIKLAKGDKIKYIFGSDMSYHLQVVTPDGTTDLNISDIKSQSSISTGQKILKDNLIYARLHK